MQTAEIVTITPEVAEQWLGANTHNRNLSRMYIDRLAGAIRRGEWQFNGESIKFNGDGTLIDGQHRLSAIAKSGVPVAALVVHNVSMSAQDTVDVGKKRSLADALKLRGETECAQLAGAVTIIWRFERDQPLSNVPPTITEAMTTLERHPRLRASIPIGRQLNSWIRYPNASGTALHYWLSLIDQDDDADDFFDRLKSGAFLHEGHPILTLRQAVERDARQDRRMRTQRLQALTIKAWNAYRDGSDLHFLKWKPGGSRPEPFPKPH